MKYYEVDKKKAGNCQPFSVLGEDIIMSIRLKLYVTGNYRLICFH